MGEGRVHADLCADSLGRRIIMLANWNEFGEGHFLLPSTLADSAILTPCGRCSPGAAPHEDSQPNRGAKSGVLPCSIPGSEEKAWQGETLRLPTGGPLEDESCRTLSCRDGFPAGGPLAALEWAMWWDETIANWKQQGLPAGLESVFEIAEYFGLDPYQQSWFSTTDDTIEAVQHHVEGIVSNMDDYLRLCAPSSLGCGDAVRPSSLSAR